MSETKELLRRGVGGFEPMPDAFERVLVRRDRKRRNQRVAAGVLGIAVFALAAIGFVRLLGSEGTPASDPRSPFEGTWVSTSDTDGGTKTMTVSVSADGAVEIVVLDDVATVCSGTPSTMTGTGRIEGGTALVIPAPVYTCDDGSEAATLSGPPLQEVLRDWTLFLDPETDTLSDGVGGVWLREGAADPTPAPPTSGTMWPQSRLEEVRQAQELADAGDPAYTWQVDPRLTSQESDPLLTDPELWSYFTSRGAEIVERFLREELGWDEFLFSGEATALNADGLRGLVYLRCAPGETNPLWPIAPVHPKAPRGDLCAPTINELRYEAVRLDLFQPDRRGPDGIWVVNWTATQFAQADPSVVEAEATARLEDFLRARIDGEGAEGFVEVFDLFGGSEDVPLLYATTTGAPYERFEVELVDGPHWPRGEMEYAVRLFADGGETVVEQLIDVFFESGRPTYRHNVASTTTTENSQPLPES